jgi:hypothetical protein
MHDALPSTQLFMSSRPAAAVNTQAKAIHVASCLETRRMVHALLADKLLQHAGSEAAAAAMAATGGFAGISGYSTGPLAAVISNTMISSQGLVSSDRINQNVEASPSAVATGNTNTNSSTASSSAAPAQGRQFAWGLAGLGMSVGTVLLLVWNVAGVMFKVVVAVVVFAKDLALQLLMLRAVAATAKGLVASSRFGQLQMPAEALVPKLAAAGPAAAAGGAAGGCLQGAAVRKLASPEAAAAGARAMQHNSEPQQLQAAPYAVLDQQALAAEPAAGAQHASSSKAQQGSAAAATLGSLGLLSAVPLGTRQSASTAAAAAHHHQQQHARPPLPAAQLAKLRNALRRKQQGRAVSVAGSDRLLYQLWAPEAARC